MSRTSARPKVVDLCAVARGLSSSLEAEGWRTLATVDNNPAAQSVRNRNLALADAKIGKNYLDGDELYAVHILCEQLLLFVESRSLRGQAFTMAKMSTKFDELIAVQVHPVFEEYRDFLKDRAMKQAERGFQAYKQEVKRLAS